MDYKEHARKRLEELVEEELELKKEIEAIQTERNAILNMLNAIEEKQKERGGNESKPLSKSVGPNQR